MAVGFSLCRVFMASFLAKTQPTRGGNTISFVTASSLTLAWCVTVVCLVRGIVDYLLNIKKCACLICPRHYSDFKNEDTLNSHLCCIASQMIMNKLDSPTVRGVEDETSLPRSPDSTAGMHCVTGIVSFTV